MADFQTFDLGRILQTAETIKGLRAQAETDKLRNAYLNTQIAGAQQEQQFSAQQNAAQQEALLAKRQYFIAQAALNSGDPKGVIESIAPDAVKAWEAQHGAGSWQNLTPEQAHAAARAVQMKAESIIGPQQKVKWIDAGGQQIPVDEQTGQPIRGAAPIAKSASPDSMLSAQTSTANAQLSARTSRENAQLAADTARANNAASIGATLRGQDITAETARRGQDLNQKNQPNSPQQLDKTWGTYQQAKAGLLKALGGSETGPVAGRIPAVTTAQQTAEGGVSAMAPVLKQIFRVAGEGTFTDKDQELLMQMVPTRTDRPEARQQKIDNIDNIIRAKLGKPVPEARKHLGGQDYLQIGGQWYVDDGT